MKHTMSLRLVEGGLARVAGQSCLAGSSVCSTSCDPRRSDNVHLPFTGRGNKKGANRSRLQHKCLSGCLQGMDTVQQDGRRVCASCVHAPVTSLAQSILRELSKDCKCF